MIASLALLFASLQPQIIDGDMHDFSQSISYIVDDTHSMSMEEALAAFAQGHSQRTMGSSLNLGMIEKPVFVALALKNQSSAERFVVDINYPPLDDIELVVFKEGKRVNSQRSGDIFEFSARYVPHRNPNFALQLFQNEQSLLIFRVNTKGATQFPLRIYTEKSLVQLIANENISFGIYIGIVITMIILNIFLLVYFREILYLYYTGYLIFFTLFQLSISGVLFQYALPHSPQLINSCIALFILVGGASSLAFSARFLRMEEYSPRGFRLLDQFAHIIFAVALITPFIPYSYMVRFFPIVGLGLPVVYLSAGIFALRKGSKHARFFILGWALFIIGMIVYSLKTLSFLPVSFLTENAMNIGAAIEVLLVSLALVDRMQLLQHERDDANAKVMEGYQRLNMEINRGLHLEQENNILEKEMNLATAQLIQADKMVLLGQLTASIAHDIANPIQLIGIAQKDGAVTSKRLSQRVMSLFDDEESEEAKAIEQSFAKDFARLNATLEEINLGASHITGIQQAIRNQSRVDAMQDLVAIRPIIEECMIILRTKLTKWNIQIICEDKISIRCRRSQIGQIISNLLSNACDALSESGHQSNKTDPDILLRVIPGENINYIWIEIEDNGTGICPGKEQEIFKPFVSSKPIGQGTGLGLPICVKIAEAHGGSISLTPARHLKGACFRVQLPIQELVASQVRA